MLARSELHRSGELLIGYFCFVYAHENYSFLLKSLWFTCCHLLENYAMLCD